MMRLVWIGGLGLVLALMAGCEKKEAATSPGGETQTAPTPAAPKPETPAARTAGEGTRPAGESREATTAPEGKSPAAPGTEPAQAKAPAGPPKVEMRIRQGNDDWGWTVIELDSEKAPITTKNFLRYVDEGYFNGTIFHRVIPTFMIQGGGYTAPGQKKPGQHEGIQIESQNGLKNTQGTIAMARSGHPNSATSEFFINVKDNPGLDYPGQDGFGYTVFGRVVDGMDVVDKIKNVETVPNPEMRGEKSLPVNPPVIVTAQRAK